jgi:hypothetical protein
VLDLVDKDNCWVVQVERYRGNDDVMWPFIFCLFWQMQGYHFNMYFVILKRVVWGSSHTIWWQNTENLIRENAEICNTYYFCRLWSFKVSNNAYGNDVHTEQLLTIMNLVTDQVTISFFNGIGCHALFKFWLLLFAVVRYLAHNCAMPKPGVTPEIILLLRCMFFPCSVGWLNNQFMVWSIFCQAENC